MEKVRERVSSIFSEFTPPIALRGSFFRPHTSEPPVPSDQHLLLEADKLAREINTYLDEQTNHNNHTNNQLKNTSATNNQSVLVKIRSFSSRKLSLTNNTTNAQSLLLKINSAVERLKKIEIDASDRESTLTMQVGYHTPLLSFYTTFISLDTSNNNKHEMYMYIGESVILQVNILPVVF